MNERRKRDSEDTQKMDAETLAELRSLSSIPPRGPDVPASAPEAPRLPDERLLPEPPEAA